MKRLGVLIALALLAACGGGGGDSTDGAKRSDEPQPAEPAASTPTPQPSPLGTQQEYDGGTVTAHAYTQPVATDSPQPVETSYPDGYVWAGLDVEVCVPEGEPSSVSRTPWSLTYEDGALVTASHTGYAGFPQPEYPWGDQMVTPGQCIRGWIVFAVPGAGRPTGASYASPVRDTPATWAIG